MSTTKQYSMATEVAELLFGINACNSGLPSGDEKAALSTCSSGRLLVSLARLPGWAINI